MWEGVTGWCIGLKREDLFRNQGNCLPGQLFRHRHTLKREKMLCKCTLEAFTFVWMTHIHESNTIKNLQNKQGTLAYFSRNEPNLKCHTIYDSHLIGVSIHINVLLNTLVRKTAQPK